VKARWPVCKTKITKYVAEPAGEEKGIMAHRYNYLLDAHGAIAMVHGAIAISPATAYVYFTQITISYFSL